MSVLALDLSLTGTGVATASGVSTIKTKLKDEERIFYIAEQLINYIPGDLSLVIVEGLAYGTQTGKAMERAGLWWFLKLLFYGQGMPVAVCPPTVLKRYACGKGNADKATVMLEVAKRYDMFKISNDNEADSVALYALAMDKLGTPLVEVPKTHRDALDKVQWPEGI